jgi:SSS family transporter
MAHLSEYFSLLDYVVFALYLLGTLAIGTLFIKGQRDLNEYFLAGRTMGSVLVAMTILASLFSGISFLAAPSEGYANGPVFYLANIAFFIATPVTAMLILPFYYNSRFFTAYQYLEERFSVPLRTLASASFIVRVLLWLAAATYAPALALEQATGLPLWFTILCTGLLTTIYTTFGGMRAVIWTDVMQLVVLAGGQLVIMLVALGRVPGGIDRVIEIGRQGGRLDLSLSADPTVRLTLWGLLIGATFMHLVQMATDQVSVQRYLSARSLEVARRGLWLKLAMLLPVTVIFYGTGLVLYAFYQIHGDPLVAGKITKADQILPYFVINELPHGLPGLFIAAIYAASMSTISAGINSLTSVSLVDFYQRLWRRPDLSEKNQLRIARALTFGYGTLVVLLAFLVHRLGTLLEATNKVIGLVGGPLLGLFLLGILLKRATARGALIGWVAGLVLTLWVCFGTNISFLWYAMIGCLTTMVIGFATSWFEPAPGAPPSN